MFITREAYRSPVSALFLSGGDVVWTATELGLQQIWFLAHLEEVDTEDGDGYASNRTMLLSDFQSIEHFLQSSHDGKVRLKSVHILTPGHVNGSDGWQMDRLRAVWQGREMLDEHPIPTDIFETVSGKKYPASFCGLSVEELAGDTLKFRFPH